MSRCQKDLFIVLSQTCEFYENDSVLVFQIKELKRPRGIAVDWVAGNLYWTDSGRDVIEVAQMSGQHCKTLISGMIDEPYAIVVDPQRG